MKATKNYSAIKARLISRGTTLRRWAHQNGFKVSTVYAAASNTRRGVMACRIMTELNKNL